MPTIIIDDVFVCANIKNGYQLGFVCEGVYILKIEKSFKLRTLIRVLFIFYVGDFIVGLSYSLRVFFIFLIAILY